MKAVSALPRGPWTLQGSCRPSSSGRGKNLFLYFSRGIKTASKGPSRCPCCAFEEESEEPCCVRGDAIDPSRTLGARVRVTRGLVGALGLVCRCLVRGMRAQGLWKECEVRSQVLSTTRRPNPTWPDRRSAGAGK